MLMSVLTYGMPVWAGCPDYLLTVLQGLQNEAARIVTGSNWEIVGVRRVSTAELLRQCGWLSVRQLCVYTSLVELQKVVINKEPRYLYEKLTGGSEGRTHGTRQNYMCVNGVLEPNGSLISAPARLDITKSSWRWRTVLLYNELPAAYRMETDIKQYKCYVKKWVSQNH